MACSAKTLLQQNSELMNQLIDVSLGGGGGDGEEDTVAGGVHLCCCKMQVQIKICRVQAT